MENKDKKIKMVDIIPIEKKIEPARVSIKETKKEIEEKIKEEIGEEHKIEEKISPEISLEISSEIPLLLAEEKRERVRSGFKKYFLTLLILVFVGGLIYAALEFLPRVEIKIIAKKTPWNYEDWLWASKETLNIDAVTKRIPAEIFKETKNVNLAYPSNGRKMVEKKASGEITIYNAFSSKPQTLIIETRFETLDGKVFFLTKKIIVPGAEITDGKIVPSSVKATVIAEKEGAEYNISSVAKFSIPAFKGSPKYDGFYAKSDRPIIGGFVGEMSYPTEDDIRLAKGKNRAVLEESLNILLTSQMPKELKIIEGGKEFKILKETIGEEIDSQGNFSVFSEAVLAIIAFRESDALELMKNLAKSGLGDDFKEKEYSLQYGATRGDFGKGELSFKIDYKGIFWQKINIESFKNSVLNKKENELKVAVFSLPGVEKAIVSFWPFWVKSVPDKTNRIKVMME